MTAAWMTHLAVSGRRRWRRRRRPRSGPDAWPPARSRTAGPFDGTGHAGAHPELVVGSVDHGLDVEQGDVADRDLEHGLAYARVHGRSDRPRACVRRGPRARARAAWPSGEYMPGHCRPRIAATLIGWRRARSAGPRLAHACRRGGRDLGGLSWLGRRGLRGRRLLGRRRRPEQEGPRLREPDPRELPRARRLDGRAWSSSRCPSASPTCGRWASP